MASLKKQSNSLKPQKKLVLPILLLCEDEKGVVSYLEQRIKTANLTCARIKQVNVNAIIWGKQGQHHTIVEKAIKELEFNLKTSADALELPYDKLYCVMDYDIIWHDDKAQRGMEKVYNLIKDKNAELKKQKIKTRLQHIVTNDCFELWYLLHFWKEEEIIEPLIPYYRSGVKNTDNGEKIGRKLWEKLGDGTPYSKQRYEDIVKGEKKGNIFDLLLQKGGNEAQAIKNAEKLENLHIKVWQQQEKFLLFRHNPSTEVHCLIKKFEKMQKRMNNTHFSI